MAELRSMAPEKVTQIRAKMGMNVTEFARECNTTRQTVHTWENGSKPPSGTATRLLELFEELHDENSAGNSEGT